MLLLLLLLASIMDCDSSCVHSVFAAHKSLPALVHLPTDLSEPLFMHVFFFPVVWLKNMWQKHVKLTPPSSLEKRFSVASRLCRHLNQAGESDSDLSRLEMYALLHSLVLQLPILVPHQQCMCSARARARASACELHWELRVGFRQLRVAEPRNAGG